RGVLFAFRLAGVHLEDDSELLEIVLARGPPCRFARPGEGGKENRGQNPDDGDDNQQFDERETSASCVYGSSNHQPAPNMLAAARCAGNDPSGNFWNWTCPSMYSTFDPPGT